MRSPKETAMPDPSTFAWRISSRCTSSGCVAASFSVQGKVHVTDSTVPDGPVLQFSATAWTDFAAAIRAGEFRAGGSSQ
jgi:hypothetical protein